MVFLRLWHGSDCEGLTELDPVFSGVGYLTDDFGQLVYATSSIEEAISYGKYIYEIDPFDVEKFVSARDFYYEMYGHDTNLTEYVTDKVVTCRLRLIAVGEDK